MLPSHVLNKFTHKPEPRAPILTLSWIFFYDKSKAAQESSQSYKVSTANLSFKLVHLVVQDKKFR